MVECSELQGEKISRYRYEFKFDFRSALVLLWRRKAANFVAEKKKMDGFPLPHTQFKQVFVLLTLGRVTPTTKALYRTNRKICWPLSMIDKTGLSPLQPCVV